MTDPTDRPDMAARMLVAGIGNLFLGDDGFGPEVVRRLAKQNALEPEVRVVDYGIRGMHLAHDLLDPCDALVLVDALPGGGAPGEVVVFEIGPDDLGSGQFDAHGMNPVAMLAGVERLGGTLPATYVVGCRVADVGEGIGLSAPVAAAVPAAVEAVRTLVGRLIAAAPAGIRRC
ncbi:hydrogenase maturation protease [Paractinoplanes brasiliensis]|uniref:Hydrogenase maturation protease n=1 Tax=Paractinoplanes brasiliensis TaxID=52695 RepID=A0A4V3C796_9ACTN|nr:hydrogenase maturation protease [Actinoplanes brasiliensis]TDO36888.1 hydrogenase maturation protease [Actinoplanes brasiliensis]GID30408.1 peptidase M52 [Actinoplanes brasiliensis]